MDRSIGGIAVQPGDPATIMVGLARGRHGGGEGDGGSTTPPNASALGVYRTTNGGASFSNDFAPAQPGGDPANIDSTDTARGGVVQVANDPVDPTIVYASIAGSGIWRRDGAGAWTRIFEQQDPGDGYGRAAFTLIAHNTSVHMYVFAGNGSADAAQGQVWRTLDAATVAPGTWTLLSSTDVASNLYGSSSLCGAQCWYDQSIAGRADGTHDVVWLGGMMQYNEVPGWSPGGDLDGISNGRSVVRSANAEASPESAVVWNDMTIGKDSGTTGSHPDQHAIALNPSNPDQAFLGSDGGIVRTDGTFSDMSLACGNRPAALADPSRQTQCQQLLSAVPTRVVGMNSGLSTLQVIGVASSAASRGDLIAGFQDNGTASNRGGTTWTGLIGGDGGPPAFDVAGSGIAYHQYTNGAVEVSYDHGDPGSWLAISTPMSVSGEAASFYAPLTTDPVTAGTVYSGWGHVWRSTDRGGDRAGLVANCSESAVAPGPSFECGDFAPLGPNLTDAVLGDRDGGTVSVVSRTTADTGTLWAATSHGRVFVSKNASAPSAGVTFARIDHGSAIVPTRFPSAIEVDPTDPNHAWVAYAGYNAYTPSTPGHLFEVRFTPATGDSTWVDRSYDLGDVPLRDMVYDPALGDIYASGDWGVMRLPGGATSWMDAGTALPQVATYSLSIDRVARVLYAGTHGRGVYSLALPDPAPGPAPPAPTPDAAPGAATPTTPALTARVVPASGNRMTVGPAGTFIINLGATAQSGTGTITLDGSLPPASGRPTTARLSTMEYRFSRNHATRVTVRLPVGSRRALGRAGRMNVTAKVAMRSAGGQRASTTAKFVLVASPRLQANSR
jgi:hypothetical protein